MSTTHPFTQRRCWLLIATLLLLALLAAPALAQTTPPTAPGDAGQDAASPAPPAGAAATPALVASETQLVFRGNTGETLGRSFTLTAVGGPVGAVRLSASDLLATGSDRAIPAKQVTISPAQAPSIADQQSVDVTVAPGTAQADVYTGTLSIWYAAVGSTDLLTTPLTIALQVTLDAVPSVAADANSVNQTLFGQTTDLPYVGTPISRTQPVLGELPVALIASTLSPAQVTAAEVLSVRNANGLILPSGVVRVQASLPLTIPGQGALTLPLVLGGKNLPAGDYTGNLRVQIANQPTVIQVPFAMQLRDNWLYAVLVLLASFVVGAAVAWYNNGGGAAVKTIQDVNRRQARLRENPWRLAMAEKAGASERLAAVMVARRNDDSQSAIDAALKVFDDYVQAAAKAIDDERQTLYSLHDQIAQMEGAPGICQQLETRRAALLASIDAGSAESLAAIQRERKAIEAELAALPALKAAVAALTPEQQQQIDLPTATSCQQVGERLRALLIGQVEKRQGQLGAMQIGEGLRRDLAARLASAAETLKTTSLSSLGEVSAQVADLERDVDAVQKLQDEWATMSSAVQPMPDDVRTAATLADLAQALHRAKPAGQIDQPPDGGWKPPSYDVTGGAPAATDQWQQVIAAVAGAPDSRTPGEAAAEGWMSYTVRVRLGSLLVKALVYLFALGVGWAALYLSNPTFGARPEDYIALFLWGATVNVIAGQQISLNSILGQKVQQITLNPQAQPAAPANAGGAQPQEPQEPATP